MLRSVTQGILFSAVVAIPFSAAIGEENDAGIEFFEKKIRPVLAAKCYKCHSASSKEPKGGLLLDTREGIRLGGESGHSVVPGDLGESMLLDAIRYESFEMPPDEQLPDEVIRDFEKWIRMGAPDPRDGKSALIRREIDFEKAREFWAFQPIERPEIPDVVTSGWVESNIDHFILSRLESKNLQPVADADPAALVRRLYMDLTGLPPTVDELGDFLADPSPRAYRELVDRLLDSPHFGERWGRHWLDVVRYAESSGMERNYSYPQAWRFRDYVIESFNVDKPFDQFVLEQIAGDLLPEDNPARRDERYIATGMLALGPKSLNETNAEKFYMDIVDEQIDVTTRAFLGLTASCARCHDHKFDPIPTKEYYSLAGIFRSTSTLFGTTKGGGNRHGGNLLALGATDVRTIAPKDPKKTSSDIAKITKQLQAAEKRLSTLKSNRKDSKSTQTQSKRLSAQVKKLKSQLDKAQPEENELDAYIKIMAVLDQEEPADTQVRIRGEANDKGSTVPRGFLTIASCGQDCQVHPESSGRLQYAEWLVSEQNPLTARVTANRIWQHLFGRGIVATVNNFGANGERPTHPELLDYLAVSLRENAWSFKSMIREIVTSRVYRLSGDDLPAALDVDPDNKLLWRANHRRLEVEALRDAILLASGQLDLMPKESSVVADVGDANIGRGSYQAMFDSASSKRSVYLPIVRGFIPEMLSVFDFPEPSIIAGQRDVTTVPTQALFMMNSPFVIEQADLMARRLFAAVPDDDEQRLDLAYRIAYSRHPTQQETAAGLQYLAETQAAMEPGGNSDGPSDAECRLTCWGGLCQAIFASAEFRYVE